MNLYSWPSGVRYPLDLPTKSHLLQGHSNHMGRSCFGGMFGIPGSFNQPTWRPSDHRDDNRATTFTEVKGDGGARTQPLAGTLGSLSTMGNAGIWLRKES